ncbi:hypothetical protein BH23CHL5_BH23CHL5_13640 [soil metagenome]
MISGVRAAITRVLVVLLLAMLLVPAMESLARSRERPDISLSVFQCPAGMTASSFSLVDCDPLPEGFSVEIVSIDGSQPKVTEADAARAGHILRWQVTPTDAEIDKWGIRQTTLPEGSSSYAIQGDTVTAQQTPMYDFRFTTSEADPSTDLMMFVFTSALAGVIIPPSEQQEFQTEVSPEIASDEQNGDNAATNLDGVQTRTNTASTDTRTIRREPVPLRLAADSRASIVEQLGIGDRVEVLNGPFQSGSGDWYEVSSASGAIGWIPASGFEPPTQIAAAPSAPANPNDSKAPPPAIDAENSSVPTTQTASSSPTPASADPDLQPGDRAIVFDPPLSLRMDPGTDGTIADTLAEGQMVSILSESGQANGYTWYEVEVLSPGGQTGFVAGAFLQIVGFLKGERVVVSDGPANLRSAPSTGADILDSLDKGAFAVVLSGPAAADGQDWYEIEHGEGAKAWISGSLLTLPETASAGLPVVNSEPGPVSESFRAGAWLTVVDPPINLRSAPGISSAEIDALQLGDVVIVLSEPEMADGYSWYLVETSGQTGYVAGEFLDGGFLPGETVRVFDGPVYLRTGPSVSSDIVIGLLQDELLTVVSPMPLISGDYLWIEVSTSDNSRGYVATDFIAPVD